MAQHELAQRMEHIVIAYIRACNEADAAAVAACLAPDAVHYYPVGVPGFPKPVGAPFIGAAFARMVQEQGVCWTVDQLLTDVDRHATVLEYTKFNRERDRIVRGVDWFVFDPETVRIQEVRPYMAARADPEMVRHELEHFDYGGRGYPTG